MDPVSAALAGSFHEDANRLTLPGNAAEGLGDQQARAMLNL